MNNLSNIKHIILCLSLLVAAMQHCIAAPHAHKKAGQPAFCHSTEAVSNPDCGKTPTAGFDNQGILWIVYVDGEYIKLVSSSDFAESYSLATTINSLPEKIYADGENRPKIAFGQENEIYISWVKKTEGRFSGDIRFSRSIDNGKSFSEPITVNDDNLLTSHRFETMAVSPDGRIHLTWLDKRDLVAAKKSGNKYTGAAIYHAVSSDKGLSFSKNSKIADSSCECCRISIDFNQQGNAIALWRHIYAGMIRDHAIINLDSTETVINRVTFDNWKVEGCPHHGPDMAIGTNDELHLAWFTGLPDRGGLFYGRYNQHNQKLEKQVTIDSSATASRPQILVNNQQILFVWKVFEQEQTKLQFKISNDNGDNWSETITLITTTAGSDHPLLFSHENKIFISWWTETKGFQLISVDEKIKSKTLSLIPFNKKSLVQIEKQHENTEFVLVLWSLDCPPCFKELEYLSTLVTQKNSPKLVLVSTDNAEFTSEIISTLKEFGLENEENWLFDSIPESLRSSIDNNWFGELPRSYLYAADGKRSAHSGPLNHLILQNRFK
ncbi:MAG: hypothetical protein HND53_02290 [Proteobacteria bacterium]|nr:hypothetical protein [Pseudomonadota bacterium]NOG59300.1 hypothetical protein [Pseudomonadota bacterium]